MGAARAGASTTRLTVRAQIYHGMTEAGYGYWGFSPVEHARGRLRAPTASTAIGMDPNGGTSNEDNTLIDHGFAGCPGAPGRSPTRRRPRTRTASSPRTPRSSPCATPRARRRDNLRRLRARLPRHLYAKWGFRDSVNVRPGAVSGAYLSLDQGMIMAALGNALGDDVLRRAFADRDLERNLRPVIGVEQFGLGK